MKKKSKQPLSKIQRDLWVVCKILVEQRDARKDGTIDCYTCPQTNLVGSNKQLGHGPWPKSVLSAFLKYDLRVLKFQCFRCNIHGGGMGAEFYKRLTQELGAKGMAQLERDRRVTVKAYDYYLKLLETYKTL